MIKDNPHKAIIYWLLTGCILTAVMVIIGGVTRLTESGLSMTDWQLISGTIPPLNEVDWQEAFNEYKQFPEYQKVNKGMSLSEFKFIFFWEYFHRVFGRLIGLVFIIPFLFFWLRKKISKKLMPKIILIFFLGCFQAFLGWWMVKSGLVDRPDVSHFRLATHLISAFGLISYIFWVMLGLYFQKPFPVNKKLNRWTKWILVLVVIQILYGGFVAGLKAGLLCPSFPFMCNLENLFVGNWTGNLTIGMPEHLTKINIQNIHRILAFVVYAVIALLVVKARRWNLSSAAKSGVNTLFLLVNVQFALGVFTLIYQIPLLLAVLHQFAALLLLLSIVYLLKVSK